ncbi:MAG TPA: hypothetical protein PK590_03855 [Candidatus Omnitrophota bacterium]|nr:hypothetical protein [Candidatus Omnitrophota bacterium]
MKKLASQKGFNLIEAMLAVALSSVVVFGVFLLFRVGSEQSQINQSLMNLKDSSREAIYKMVQEIRQSAPGHVIIEANGQSIRFKIPHPDHLIGPDFDVDWDSAHTITYTLGGTNSRQIIRTDTTTGMTSIIANDITALRFSENSSPSRIVTITLDTQKTLSSGRAVPSAPLQITAQADVRNP